MNVRTISVTLLSLLAVGPTGARGQTVDEMLRGFAEDYRHDPMALDAYFGIRVGEDSWWTVRVERSESPETIPHEVTLKAGEPEEPTWYFTVADAGVLNQLSERTLSAGTAYTRSLASDRTPLGASAMEGYDDDSETLARVYHLLSHFWNTGTPEVTYFERDRGLPIHGAAMVSLYTMTDKRITWFSIGPEETVNDDPRLEADETPNLFIFTAGRGRAQFADREMEVHAGMSVFIAPFVRHVISNPHEEPLEGIVVLYGDNSSFTRGTTYVEFTEDLYRYYGEYDYED